MQAIAKVDYTKENVVINDVLSDLGESLTSHMIEHDNIPPGTRYLGSIQMIDSSGMTRLCWGWSEDKKENKECNHYQSISLKELHDIKYNNNLHNLLDYDSGIIAPVMFIFPCLECIRRYYNKTIHFIHREKKTLLFI